MCKKDYIYTQICSKANLGINRTPSKNLNLSKMLIYGFKPDYTRKIRTAGKSDLTAAVAHCTQAATILGCLLAKPFINSS